MQGGRKRCSECGRAEESPPHAGVAVDRYCAACGASFDGGALSEFANRLAQFGLGATRQPLLGRVPELPDAK